MILRETIKRIFFWIFCFDFTCDLLSSLFKLLSHAMLWLCRIHSASDEGKLKAHLKLLSSDPPSTPSPFCCFDIPSIGQSLLCKCPADNTEFNPVLFCLHEYFPQDCWASLANQFTSDCAKEDCGAGSDEGTSFHYQLEELRTRFPLAGVALWGGAQQVPCHLLMPKLSWQRQLMW